MPLFTDPDEPAGLPALLQRLRHSGALLLGFMGWATVALGLAEARGPVWIALWGLVAAAFARRGRLFTLSVEIVALGYALFVAPPPAQPWLWTGVVLVGAGRALALSLR